MYGETNYSWNRSSEGSSAMRWQQLVFGWPGISCGIVVVASGVLLKRPSLVLLGTAAASGFVLYLSATHLWPAAAIVIPSSIASAVALHRGRIVLAWLLFLPMLLLPLILALAAASVSVTG